VLVVILYDGDIDNGRVNPQMTAMASPPDLLYPGIDAAVRGVSSREVRQKGQKGQKVEKPRQNGLRTQAAAMVNKWQKRQKVPVGDCRRTNPMALKARASVSREDGRLPGAVLAGPSFPDGPAGCRANRGNRANLQNPDGMGAGEDASVGRGYRANRRNRSRRDANRLSEIAKIRTALHPSLRQQNADSKTQRRRELTDQPLDRRQARRNDIEMKAPEMSRL
jgi:hypothetical protein